MEPPTKRARLTPAPTLPHHRADCPQHLFHHAPLNVSHSVNLQYCDTCYCLVCDCAVGECIAWQVHCMAFYTHPEWRALRYAKNKIVPRHLLPSKLSNAAFVGDGNHGIVDVDSEDVVVEDRVKREVVIEIDNHSTPVQERSPSNPESVQPRQDRMDTNAMSIEQVTPQGTNAKNTCDGSKRGTGDREHVRRNEFDPAFLRRDKERRSMKGRQVPASKEQERIERLTPPKSQSPSQDQSSSISPQAQSTSQTQSQPLSNTQTKDLSTSQSQSQTQSQASSQPRPIASPLLPSNTNANSSKHSITENKSKNCKQESTPIISNQQAKVTSTTEADGNLVASAGNLASSAGPAKESNARPRMGVAPVQSNMGDPKHSQINVEKEQQVHHGPGGGMKVKSADANMSTPARQPKTEIGLCNGLSILVSPTTPATSTQRKTVTADVQGSSHGSANSAIVTENKYSESAAFRNTEMRHNIPPRPVKSSFSDPGMSSYSEQVEAARRNWTVDKLFPAPHIIKKQSASAPTITGKPFPQRVLLGYIDMYRPYCSHMTARNIELPVGHHKNDIASIASKSDVRVPGLRVCESEVIAREMGLDLGRQELYEDIWRDNGQEDDWPDMSSFVGRSSYAYEDGTPMPSQVPEALLICIRANLMEVRFELSHHEGSEGTNKCKAFAMEHPAFCKLRRSVRRKLELEQCEWLTECEERLTSLEKLNMANCCRLRAWIYLAPESFSSNMVAAANFCQLDSANAHLSPLDGGDTLGQKLAYNKHRPGFRGRKISAPSMPVKNLSKLEKQWDNLELSAQDGYTRRNLKIVLSALRCHEKGYATSVGETNPTKRYPSVLEATIADGSSTWGSLCYSNHHEKDASLLYHAEEVIDDLRAISSEDEANIANKGSIGGVLSSPTFTVSSGYHSTSQQPSHIKLSLRRYQLESLAWMLDQEKRRSISDPFWVSIHGFDNDNKAVEVFYCPMTGTMSRFAPPPVKGGVLAEEMGLGKTIIAASLITSTLRQARSMLSRSDETLTQYRRDLLPSHGTLIVCPVSLLKQWEKELRSKVSPALKVLCWYGSNRTYDPDVLASNDVVLTTYGILSGGSYHALLNVHWFRVIIDESTYLKGGSGSCDSELMNLISSRRWAISGTPFGDNFKKKFMPTMRFIGVSPFARSSHFQQLEQTFTTPLHDPELLRSLAVPRFAYVMKNIMMRHVKAQKLYGEPLVELPSASGRCVLIELDPNEKQEYDKLENELKEKTWRYLRNQKAFGSNFTRLAQMARPLRIMADGVDPETLKPVPKKGNDDAKSESNLADRARKTSRSVGAKVKQLMNDVRRYRDDDSTSKFVVFTEFNGVKVEIKRYLEGHGFGVLTLDGSMSGTRRGRIIKQFEEEPEMAVLVLSMAAGACGLTLTMANVVVLFEVGLKMAMELQAVNRIHRIGQTRSVKSLTYVAKGTIDERIAEVRKRKGQPGVVGENVEGNAEELSTLEVYRSMFAYEE